MRIVSWCNGSTTVFGTVCRGSNPRETTNPKGDSEFSESPFSFERQLANNQIVNGK